MMIKDMKVALKEMEPLVREPDFLRTGREFTNFSLRPREAWANWILCSVLQKLHGDHITFVEDEQTDGYILDKKTGEVIPTEHVSALENEHNPQPSGEERIINAINKKINKGKEYAAGKWLVVFFDGAGEFYRNKIGENIKGRHHFGAIYCIGLLESPEESYDYYEYIVTEFLDSRDASLSFKVRINPDFTDWEISQIKG